MQGMMFETEDQKRATLSMCGLYRYRLDRLWDDDRAVNFLMLNPSKADSYQDDPTTRRCLGYAKAWGFGRLILTNLFGFRATDPNELRQVEDPIGPGNDAHILTAAREAQLLVCAWGIHGRSIGRDKIVLDMLREAGIRLHCLAQTATGMPGHPLFLPSILTPRPFDPERLI